MNNIRHIGELAAAKKSRSNTMICLVALVGVCSLTAWTVPGISNATADRGVYDINQECFVLGGEGAGGATGGASGPATGGPSGTGGGGGTGGTGGAGDNGGTGGAGGQGGTGGNSGTGGAGGESTGGAGGEGGRGGDGEVTCIIDDSFRSRTTIIQNTLSPKSTIGLSTGWIGPITQVIPIP